MTRDSLTSPLDKPQYRRLKRRKETAKKKKKKEKEQKKVHTCNGLALTLLEESRNTMSLHFPCMVTTQDTFLRNKRKGAQQKWSEKIKAHEHKRMRNATTNHLHEALYLTCDMSTAETAGKSET